MSSNSIERELEAFHEALEQDEETRTAFVERKHGHDPALANRILRLLEAQKDLDRGSRMPASSFMTHFGPETKKLPEKIGPYRILECLGEGGMGVVYAAEQRHPFHRRVAIKVIKPGMDSKEVLTRFEVERQAMVLIDHPGVAKVLDAGATDQGRPYFVMELVAGRPLTEYCEHHELSLRERLDLFVKVCAAIQHAHHRGIIHRDLKPSNILITLQDGEPHPKVIDFGIAKATSTPLTDRTLFTEQGQMIGTPEYMSPEQADLTSRDVDTRSDVYSLGVILYELLTGTLPFSSKELRSGGYLEALRQIREIDPPRPSTRLGQLSAEVDGASGRAAARVREVRGDLDWIVMRAIEKDPKRRYDTVSNIIEDIQRHLNDRPILAGPPSALYGLMKFVRRHRVAAAFLALLLFSATIGVIGLMIGFTRARDAEELARSRAENAQATAGFLRKVLFQTDPEFGGGSLTLLEAMERTEQLIATDLEHYPEVEASVRESIGVALRRRSHFEMAGNHLERSLQIRRRVFGPSHLETARAQIALANLVFEEEGRIREALTLLHRALRTLEAHDLLGQEPEAWLQLDIGLVELAADNLLDAERAFVRCQELLARSRGGDHPDTSRPMRGLAMIALHRGDAERAEEIARKAMSRSVGKNRGYIRTQAQMVLAEILGHRGRMDAASELLDQIGPELDDRVGSHHVRIAEREALLARFSLSEGNPETALVSAERCLELRKDLLHSEHWQTLEAQLLVLDCRRRNGSVEAFEAGVTLIDIERLLAGRLGADHRLTIRAASSRLEEARSRQDTLGVKALTKRIRETRARRSLRIAGK